MLSQIRFELIHPFRPLHQLISTGRVALLRGTGSEELSQEVMGKVIAKIDRLVDVVDEVLGPVALALHATPHLAECCSVPALKLLHGLLS